MCNHFTGLAAMCGLIAIGWACTGAGVEGAQRQMATDALMGRRVELPFSVYQTTPVDLDGDGRHELLRGTTGEVFDRKGRPIGNVGGSACMASKFLNRPGEQLMVIDATGKLRIWADVHAEDAEVALARYALPFYATNQRLGASGTNRSVLGGL